jgi:hypothetical protein
MPNFSKYQTGIDFKRPYSNLPLKPLTPLNRLNAIFVLAVQGSRNPLIYLIGR